MTVKSPERDLTSANQIEPIRHQIGRGSINFQVLFEATPEPYLVLDLDFTIVAANDAYLRATMTERASIVGRPLFDVFPDSPVNGRAMATSNVRASLLRVLETQQPDTMAVQKYDIPSAGGATGFEERYWSPVNLPVFGEAGELICLLHRVEDVTDFMQMQEVRAEQSEQTEALQARTRQLEVEMFERAQELQRVNQALRRVNQQRDLVLDSVADAIVALDHDWRITYLNSKAAQRIDSPQDSLVGRSLWELFPNQCGQAAGQRLKAAMALGGPEQFDHFSEESRCWTENRAYPSPEGLVLFSTDVTSRKNSELRLDEMRTRLQLAIRAAHLGFWEIELNTGNVYFAPECKQQLDYSDDDWPDDIEFWRSLIHPDDLGVANRVLRDFRQAPRDEEELEYRLKHKDGSYRWIYARFMLIRDAELASGRLIVTHLDINQRKQTSEQMRHSAYHDPLTGLPNRAQIYQFTEGLIAEKLPAGEPFAMLFLDLDRFKPINDLYGHAMGDSVLKTVSERLAGSVRSEDLVGRLAGDEFVVVLPEISNEDDAGRVAEHILEVMAQPYQISGHELRISPSIGISIFPSSGRSVGALIQSADVAMYDAKEHGRNHFRVFDPALARKATRTHELEQRMRRSLDQQEFKLFYQPILDTGTCELVAVEALLRWFPDGAPGEGPAMFIPIAETNGIIRPLGDWVFREACKQHLLWLDQGLPAIPVAVNVSPVQLLQKDFHQDLLNIISEVGISPEYLRVEVTETAVMKDTEEAIRTLKKLKNLGLRVALDDFGTGYSSLSYLSQLPIDTLKVDKSFTCALQTKNAKAIVEAILSLGRALNLSVVAEGVESGAAYQLMRERGCQSVQGHYFCEPLSAEEFGIWHQSERVITAVAR